MGGVTARRLVSEGLEVVLAKKMSARSLIFPHSHVYECDSTQSTVVTDHARVVEDLREHTVDYSNCRVLLCAQCSTVMADTLGVCGEAKNIKSIICLKVTKDVRASGKFEVRNDGPLAFCTYKVLECSRCHHIVGGVLYSTPPCLSSLRNLFLLRKEALNCYMLNNGAVVKASKVGFETTPLRSAITELQQDLEAQMKQVHILKEMLEELSIPREDRPSIVTSSMAE